MIINGKEREVNDPIKDPKPETPHNLEKFLVANHLDLNAKTNSEPPHGKMQKVIDGVLVDFKFWTYEYPGYGEVTRYVGIPVEKN